MLVKMSIAEQIKLIESDGDMVVVHVTKHGNFICVDKSRLDEKMFTDDTKTEETKETKREYIKASMWWKQFHGILADKGVVL